MTIAFVVAAVMAGVFAGFTAHQRVELRDKTDEIRDLHGDILDLTGKLASAKSEISAHGITLTMLMEEVDNENHEAS